MDLGRRRVMAVLLTAMAPLGVPLLAAAAGARERAAAPAEQLRVAQTLVGPLLVDGRGHTVFVFSRERRTRDACARIRGCLRDWPALTTAQRPIAGPGVRRSLLGTIPYRGHLRQLTYAGEPLHTYRYDDGPGSVINIGNHQFGGVWSALSASARRVS